MYIFWIIVNFLHVQLHGKFSWILPRIKNRHVAAAAAANNNNNNNNNGYYYYYYYKICDKLE
jgi:hypothetical protein